MPSPSLSNSNQLLRLLHSRFLLSTSQTSSSTLKMEAVLSHDQCPDTGFGLVIRFVALLKLVTTSNYSATANSHTLQIIVARNKLSQFVFTSRCIVTALTIKISQFLCSNGPSSLAGECHILDGNSQIAGCYNYKPPFPAVPIRLCHTFVAQQWPSLLVPLFGP